MAIRCELKCQALCAVSRNCLYWKRSLSITAKIDPREGVCGTVHPITRQGCYVVHEMERVGRVAYHTSREKGIQTLLVRDRWRIASPHDLPIHRHRRKVQLRGLRHSLRHSASGQCRQPETHLQHIIFSSFSLSDKRAISIQLAARHTRYLIMIPLSLRATCRLLLPTLLRFSLLRLVRDLRA